MQRCIEVAFMESLSDEVYDRGDEACSHHWRKDVFSIELYKYNMLNGTFLHRLEDRIGRYFSFSWRWVKHEDSNCGKLRLVTEMYVKSV